MEPAKNATRRGKASPPTAATIHHLPRRSGSKCRRQCRVCNINHNPRSTWTCSISLFVAIMRRSSIPFLSNKPSSQRRRRPLTPPLPTDLRPRPYFFTQQQSPLLSSLPYELREQIYLELLGYNPIYIEAVEDWGDGRTRRPKKKPKKKGAVDGKGKEVPAPRSPNLPSMLSLLQTCRLIYTELYPFLLSQRLVFPTLPTLRYHLDHIPTTHYRCITNLDLNIYLPYLLFPVRQLAAPNTWIGRTVKQLQHFDVPLWCSVWNALAGGSGGGTSAAAGPSTSATSPTSISSYSDTSRRGNTTFSTEPLTGLRDLRITIVAHDYTALHTEWPKAPEDIVAVLLWEPVLACARARGWPGTTPNRDQAAAPLPLTSWTMDVSWVVSETRWGLGWPPPQLLREDERDAEPPFTLRSVYSRDARVISTRQSTREIAGMAPGLAPGLMGFAGPMPGRAVPRTDDASDGDSSSDERGDENGNPGAEPPWSDEGYVTAGAMDSANAARRRSVSANARQWWDG